MMTRVFERGRVLEPQRLRALSTHCHGRCWRRRGRGWRVCCKCRQDDRSCLGAVQAVAAKYGSLNCRFCTREISLPPDKDIEMLGKIIMCYYTMY